MRRVCFVTGTRAEFGLMGSTLVALREQPGVELQLVATGMHLDPSRGQTVEEIRRQGWAVDAEVLWPPGVGAGHVAQATGMATAEMVEVFERLRTDVVLVVGDRVEAFAAATAGHLSGRIVAHVHGGDRAQGQADDALRHAITKLAHLHFAATQQSADRLRKLGEQDWRITQSGAPGIDGIHAAADPTLIDGAFILIIYHPTDDDPVEAQHMAQILAAAEAVIERGHADRAVAVYPNNDPGSHHVAAVLDRLSGRSWLTAHRDLPRPAFLAHLRDAAVLLGNSSSGIIEAASFGTPVLDVGPRQTGRERSGNAVHREFDDDLPAALATLTAIGPWDGPNVYGGDGAGQCIAHTLATTELTDTVRRKVIAY